MQEIYKPCPCGSGKKFKFCCQEQLAGTDPIDLLKQAESFPVYECSIMENWQECGLASILVVRQQPNLRYLFGQYLVDYYCLGLKSTIANANMQYQKIEEMRTRTPYSWVDFDYQDARCLILGAIEYADGLGFEPNRDWKHSKYVVEADKSFKNKFTYGKDGKPFYINGPNDNVPAILAKLQGKSSEYIIGGPGGF